MGAGDLSAALWQERRQLELLLFRLETQRLHLAAGNLAWLNFTSSEIEAVLDRLRFEALARNVESAAVAVVVGSGAGAAAVELIARLARCRPARGPRSCKITSTGCGPCSGGSPPPPPLTKLLSWGLNRRRPRAPRRCSTS